MKVITWILSCWIVSVAVAEEPPPPTFRTFAGAFFGASQHQDYVESELELPLLRLQSWGLAYHYAETTPFVRQSRGPHADVLTKRYDFEGDYRLNDSLRLLAVAGYHQTDSIDAPGMISAYRIGGGIGSARPRGNDRWDWAVLAGGYLSPDAVTANWWTDLHARWRALDFAQGQYLDAPFRASLYLLAGIDAANRDNRFAALYKLGPSLQLTTAYGNAAALQFLWCRNDNNPFYGSTDNGLLVGLEVTSTLDAEYVFHATRDRKRGWLPLIWGAYDIGASSSAYLSKFEMNVELVDWLIAEHPFTFLVWYESRQEYRPGDYDNIAYSVSLGPQTPIGLESFLSHGEPLVLGADFLHRSDHSLNPDPSRMPAGGQIDYGGHNVMPRVRLQTTGWDLPYRDPEIYRHATDWINRVDWRLTAGYNIKDDRNRGRFAGQLGLNWDLATIEGYVLYTRGVVSVGNETPDWSTELGVRRPLGHVFARWERYGMKPVLAHGNTLVLGIGVNL
jgi:hypothetical protein